MKSLHFFSFLLMLTFTFNSKAQGYNDDKTSMTNFIKRMYNSAPFEGVKVIEGYDDNYFISVISLEKAKYTSQSIMMRVAQVKAQSQANTFFNGSIISLDFVVKTTETRSKKSKDITVESMESIKENSYGFVKGMELLTNFETEEGKQMVFIYFKKIEDE